MGSRAGVFRVLFMGFVWSLICSSVFAASVNLPEAVKSGDLFVFGILPDRSSDTHLKVSFDSRQMQFMGTVQGTPDLQIVSDQELDIKPEGSGLADLYELKFLVLIASGVSEIILSDGTGQRKVSVNIVEPRAERGYSWIILIIGTILLIIGFKVWRYQKSSPELMSTKSLFMNYEELEKARKMYFPDEAEKELPVKQEPSDDLNKSICTRAENTVEKTSSGTTGEPAANKTVKKMQSVKLEPAFSDSPDSRESDNKSEAGEQETVSDVATVVIDNGELTRPSSSVPLSDNESPTVPSRAAGLKIPVVKEPEVTQNNGQAMVFAIECKSTGRTFEGNGSRIRIGRKKDNQIAITASEVSREHAEVFLDNGRVLLNNLTESNITRLNDRSVKSPVAVKPGDLLNLGGTEYVVVKARPV